MDGVTKDENFRIRAPDPGHGSLVTDFSRPALGRIRKLRGNAVSNPFFEVGYRIAAIACCLYSGRQVWYGLAERKITLINPDWFYRTEQDFHRDTMPIRYWMTVAGGAITTVMCFIAAIVGYWQPNS